MGLIFLFLSFFGILDILYGFGCSIYDFIDKIRFKKLISNMKGVIDGKD